MKDEEHQEQAALMQYAELMAQKDARWEMLFSIPNGGKRHIVTAQRLKKEGAKAGIPDLMLAVPCGCYSGLFLEMKSKKGRLTETQEDWTRRLEKWGYKVAVCYGWIEAKETIEKYLALKHE